MSERYIGGLVYNPPGGWSAQFSGSNYLTVADNAAFNLTSGDWTIEGWVYKTASAQMLLVSKDHYAGVYYPQYQLYVNSSNYLVLDLGTSSTTPSTTYTGTTLIPLNQWVHICAVKSGSNTLGFVNGVQQWNTTAASMVASNLPLYICGIYNAGAAGTGYISNLRIVKGTAVYTSAFTPPTGPLLPISGTSLLTCRYPTIVDGSTNAFTVTNNGTVTVSTSNPFPTSVLPNPALGGAGNGIYTLSQYASLLSAGTWPAYDPYYKNVTLNLHGNAGAVLPFNTDASTNNFQVTQAGDTRPSNLTPFITNGYWSNYFGSANFFSSSSNAAFALGTGDFTVEAWVYPDSAYTTYNYVLGVAVTNGLVFYVTGGNLVVRAYNTGDLLSSSTIPVLNTWTHVAATRSGTTLRIFVNGVQTASTTNSTNFAQGAVYAGNDSTNAAPWYGYISNLRLVKGTAVYTSNFTPSTTPLTAISGTSWLVCQSNRFVDNSTNAFTITTSGSPSVNPLQPFTAPTGTSAYGSAYFDGSGDGLFVSDNAALEPGSGSFSVECWVYFNTINTDTTVISKRVNSTSYAPFEFVKESTGNLGVWMSSSGSSWDVVSGGLVVAAKVGQWYHIVLARSGTTISYYVNGVRSGTTTSSATLYNNTGSFNIGSDTNGVTLDGYISNVRYLVGTSAYDATQSTYTVPTSPLTAITNTQLLTVQTNAPSQNNTFLDSSTNNFVITRNGNTTQGTFTPYGSNWSNSFTPNSGVQFPYTSSLTSWWTQDFTMEMWVFNNTNAVSGTNSLALQFAHGTYTAASTYWAFGTNASGQVDFYYYNGTQNRVTSSASASLSTWNHIAMVYTNSSGNISLYLNGVSVASATKSGTPQNYSGDTVNIGAVQGTYYNGFISNLRVLNGTALYTGTFTPSTAPLTAITNTQLLTCQSNRFKDNSTNNATPTLIGSPSVQRFSPFAPPTYYSTSVIGGSGYFDGSGDYLSAGDQTAFEFGSGDFTISAWVYLTSFASTCTIASKYVGGDVANSEFVLWVTTGGNIGIALDGGGGEDYIASSAGVVTLNQWQYIVASKSGTTVRLFLNGTQVASGTSTRTLNSTGTALTIGGIGSGSLLTGYISGLCIQKGTGYSSVTVPTAPISAPTNTSLLLGFTNAGILDNAMMNDLETVGNAQISTSVKKYGSASMYFPYGVATDLTMPSRNNLDLSTGDFTMEFWAYYNSFGTDRKYFLQVSGGSYWQLVHDTSFGISLRVTGYSAVVNQGSNSGWSTGTWYHVALVRSGSSFTIYRNGISIATGTSSSSLGFYSPTYIGGFDSTTAIDAYLDDFRITKGVARYTANFTPPTSQLQDQ